MEEVPLYAKVLSYIFIMVYTVSVTMESKGLMRWRRGYRLIERELSLWEARSPAPPAFITARYGKNFAQYFDSIASKFRAPAGGCTLPERISCAVTGLP